MPMKNQSEFDSQGGVKFYANPEDAPKGKSKFLYLLKENKNRDKKHPKK